MPATPNFWGQSITGAIEGGAVAGLADGGYVVVGETQGAATYTFITYYADGSARASGELTTTSGTNPIQASLGAPLPIDVVGLGDGGFAIHQIFSNGESGAYAYTATGDVRWYQATGASGPEFNAKITYGDGAVYTASARGSVSGGPAGFASIPVEGVNAATGVSLGTIELDRANVASHSSPDIAYLGDDRIVVAYVIDPGAAGGNDRDIAFDIVDFGGATPFVSFSGTAPGSSNDNDFSPSVAALDDGGFAIAYLDFANGASTDSQLLLERYDTNGTQTGSIVITGDDDATNPQIASNGTDFVVSWEDDGTARLQRYSGDTTPVKIGGVPGFAPLGADVATNVDVDYTADGRIVWGTDYSAAFEDLYRVAVYDERDGPQFIDASQGTAISYGGVAVGTNGNERLYGGNGDDRLLPSPAVTFVDGGGGTDTVDFSTASSLVVSVTSYSVGGAGFQVENVERMVATGGNDVVDAPSIPIVDLAGGDDEFAVWAVTNYSVVGGFGRDTLKFVVAGSARVEGVDLDLALTDVQNYERNGTGSVTLSGFEDLRGTDGTGADFDRLYGTDSSNTIEALAGDDIVFGRGGNDTIDGGSGDDYLRAQQGADFVYGRAGNDQLFGEEGVDRLFGGADDDKLFGNAEGDFLFGEGGKDDLVGGDGNDRLVGGDGEDRLFGDAGNDVLEGDGGIDRVFGGADGDVLIGGAGGDFLNGGAGNDQFRYLAVADSNAADGFDKIQDFTRGQDKIDLRAFSGEFVFTTAATGFLGGHQNSVFYDGAFVRIDASGDGSEDMLIRPFNVATLDASDFLL